MSETVIREVTKNVWTFSRPFSRFNLIPVGGRSTAVRLSNGDLWVLASTPLTPDTKATLDKLGPVKYIVGADALHYLFLGEFKKAYPDAKLVGVEAHLAKFSDMRFDGVYGKDPPGTTYGFEDEIKSCFFSGFVNKDVAFNHLQSKTLIVADLLFNLPPREQYSKAAAAWRMPFGLFSNLTPYSWAHKRFVWGAGTDKEAMKRDAQTVAGWDFTRIIPCHGDVIETNGKQAWAEAYKWYLGKT